MFTKTFFAEKIYRTTVEDVEEDCEDHDFEGNCSSTFSFEDQDSRTDSKAEDVTDSPNEDTCKHQYVLRISFKS